MKAYMLTLWTHSQDFENTKCLNASYSQENASCHQVRLAVSRSNNNISDHTIKLSSRL